MASLFRARRRAEVLYEAYPQSLADPDGTGTGAVRGIQERLGYLAWPGSRRRGSPRDRPDLMAGRTGGTARGSRRPFASGIFTAIGRDRHV